MSDTKIETITPDETCEMAKVTKEIVVILDSLVQKQQEQKQAEAQAKSTAQPTAPPAEPTAQPTAEPAAQSAAEQTQKSIDIVNVLAGIQKEMSETAEENKALKMILDKTKEELKNTEQQFKNLQTRYEYILDNPHEWTEEQKKRYKDTIHKLPAIPEKYIFNKITLLQCSSTKNTYLKFESIQAENTNRLIVPIKKESYTTLAGTTINKNTINMYITVPADFAEVRLCHWPEDQWNCYRLGVYIKQNQQFIGSSDTLSPLPFPLNKVPSGSL